MAQELRKSDQGYTGGMQRYRDPFTELRSEMDRMFDTFLNRGMMARARQPGGMLGAFADPDIDIHETGNDLVIEAELPGIDEKDVQIKFQDGILSVRGEKRSQREQKDRQTHLSERSYGSFERSFRLPESVDDSKISASFDKGVLRIVAPKRPEATRAERNIPIGRTAPGAIADAGIRTSATPPVGATSGAGTSPANPISPPGNPHAANPSNGSRDKTAT